MWWPTQLLKSTITSPSSESHQTSFFKLVDSNKDRPKHLDAPKQTVQPSLSIEEELREPASGLLCGKPFVLQMPNISRKTKKGISLALSDDIEEDVLVIGRTASFERSLLEKRHVTIKGNAVVRRSLTKKASTQFMRPGSFRRKDQSSLPSPTSRLIVTDLVNRKEEDYFMLDLDEAWHPDGYSLDTHTEYLTQLTSMAEGKVTNEKRARPVQARRSAVAKQKLEGGLLDLFPVSPTDDADGEPEILVTIKKPQLEKARQEITVSMDLDEAGNDHYRSSSSSPSSATLSFAGKRQSSFKGSSEEVLHFALPEEAIDTSDVYIHLGPTPRGASFKDAIEGQGRHKVAVPRSNSMSSIPSPTSVGSFLGEGRKRHSAMDLTVLATHTEDDEGWFKLAKRENESWADFSQSLNRSKGAQIWEKLAGAEKVPLPEPSLIGISPYRHKSKLCVRGAEYKPCESPPDSLRACNEPRSLSPTSHTISYSPSLERLTYGTLPFLYETLQETPLPTMGTLSNGPGRVYAQAQPVPTTTHPFASIFASEAS